MPSGSPMLLGVWREMVEVLECVRVVREICGVSTEPGSWGSEWLDRLAKILYVLLSLVTSGGLKGWNEKLGLVQDCLGQNHNTSGPSASRSSKVFDVIPKQFLCNQLLQESQQRALQSHVTGRLHFVHKNSLLSSTAPAMASMLPWAIIGGSDEIVFLFHKS